MSLPIDSGAHKGTQLGLTVQATPALGVDGGYRYTYFTQHETSREDGNEFFFANNGWTLGLSWRF